MSCWKQLGLNPTSDAKAIKKAYAVLLKKNKPDENPEGFSRINNAYKQCLKQAKQIMPEEQQSSESAIMAPHDDRHAPVQDLSIPQCQDNAAPDTTKTGQEEQKDAPDVFHVGHEHKEAASHSETNLDNTEIQSEITIGGNNQNHSPPINTTDLDAQQEQREAEAFEHAKNQIISMTQNAFELIDKSDAPKAWQFIESFEWLYDIEFKSQYSHYLLEQWLEFFTSHTKIKPKSRKFCLLYINSIFNWQEQVRDFEAHYGYSDIAPIFDVLAQTEGIEERKLQFTVDARHKGPMEVANYYARLFATLIDIILLYLIFGSLAPETEGIEPILLFIAIFTLSNALLEALPTQGSPGKILFGLKVTSNSGRRLNIIHSVWRQITYSVSTAAFKITVWINIFLGGGRLLHDRASGTRVIKR